MQHDPVPAGVTRRLGLRRHVPVILQTEATECGLACLAMVAVSLGLDTDLPSLRLRFGVSRKGANFESLVRVAAALGLASRPLKLDLHNLRELQLPCILHWDMNHFVVLKSVSARRLVIHDPRVGARTLTARGVRAALHRRRAGAVAGRGLRAARPSACASRCAG